MMWIFSTFLPKVGFDKIVDEEDTCVTKSGANLVVDPLSLQYLSGSEECFLYIQEFH